MKKFLTFLIVLIIVVAIIWVVLFVNRGRILRFAMEKGMERMQAALQRDLPSSISKAHVDSLFAILNARLKDGSLKPDDINSPTVLFKKYMKDGMIDSVEATLLVSELENVTGG